MSKSSPSMKIIDDNVIVHGTNIRCPDDMGRRMLAQVQGVLKVLDECIGMCKITMAMPFIFQNSEWFCSEMAKTGFHKYTDDLRKCSKYIKNFENMENLHLLETNEDILRMIDVLQCNNMEYDHVIDSLSEPSYHEQMFIQTLKHIRNIAKQRFYQDPRKELIQDKELDHFYKNNKMILESIDKFQQLPVRKKKCLLWSIVSHESPIIKLEHENDDTRLEYNKLYEIEKQDAIMRYRKVCYPTQYRLKIAEEDMGNARENFTKALKTNHFSENRVREERNKVQLQLMALTQKIDTVLGEKYKLLLLLTKELKELQADFDEFFSKVYLKAEEEYNAIVTVALLQKQSTLMKRIIYFQENRAARIIQREWRSLMQIVRAKREDDRPKKNGKKKENKKGKKK